MVRGRILGILVLVAVACGLGYVGWLLVIAGKSAPLLEARRVPHGDQEIAWINLATNSATWERFIEGLHHAQIVLRETRSPLELKIEETDTFPQQTAAIPEVSLQAPGVSGRLWIRYYKLTSEMDAAYWIRELGERKPAPLAIIGGTSSDLAHDLARALRDREQWHGQKPLFLIPTATSDRVAVKSGYVALPRDEETEDLMRVYPDRSFRFCFTNSQMAEAVASFIWSQKELRPDAGPGYLVSWLDDPYSQDLVKQFHELLWPREPRSEHKSGARPAFEPPGPPSQRTIPHSMGGYSRPNARESDIAERLLDELGNHPTQERALLVLPAATQPARRFLRALAQNAPLELERFIVATGDYIDFNTVCRDRNFAWPIQDLPVRLVFFCHRNPVDSSAGFAILPDLTSTSTDSMLLYSDMALTLVRQAFQNSAVVEEADGLRDGLRRSTTDGGQLRFDAHGNLRGGSGEFVVYLSPDRNEHHRVLPRAWLHMYRRSASRGGWDLVRKLQLSYTGRGSVIAGDPLEMGGGS